MILHSPLRSQGLGCTVRRLPSKMPKDAKSAKERSWGSATCRSDYSFPPTPSSFVAFSCLFSLTSDSFSILLNVSSDKRESEFSSTCMSGHYQVPPRAMSHHWSSHRQATPKSHSSAENSVLWFVKSALVCELLKINELNFHC